MTKQRYFGCLRNRRFMLVVASAALAAGGCAQPARPPANLAATPSAPAHAPAPSQPAIGRSPAARNSPVLVKQPEALDLLKRMSDTLGSAHAFTFRSRSTIEVPAKSGQFVTLIANSEVALERPDKLRVHVTGEVRNFEFYYDGSSITAFDPKADVYSSRPAPGTIDEMLKFVEQQTGIYFPSADVMYSNPYAVLSEGLTSAFVVGSATVDGHSCKHLAFRSPGVNWEIWVDTGPRAIPRRLAVTYTNVTNFPRFLVEFSNWNFHPKLSAAQFVFKKPRNAGRVEFRPGQAGQRL